MDNNNTFHFQLQPSSSSSPVTQESDSNQEKQKSNYQQNPNQPSQKEMMEYLIAKIKVFPNVEIKTKEVNNVYKIKAQIDLSKIGNGVFYNAQLNTVSHNARIINIKVVFTDNDNLIRDMKINTDSLIQCLRDIAPDTIENIHMDTYKEHLGIVASTVRGASLIYIYKRIIEFVKIINEKYGVLPPPTSPSPLLMNMQSLNTTDPTNPTNPTEPTNSDMITDSHSQSQQKLLEIEKKIQQQMEQQLQLQIQKEQLQLQKEQIQREQLQKEQEQLKIINMQKMLVVEQQKYKDLETEEHNLQLQIDNIKKLKIEQQKTIENIYNSIPNHNNNISNPKIHSHVFPTPPPGLRIPVHILNAVSNTPVTVSTAMINPSEPNKKSSMDPTSFAFKVINGLKK
jgi:hypothetical protein